MFIAAGLAPLALDVSTLSFVAAGLTALLGMFLLFAWLQQREVRALAWWGAAYLIGALAIVLWMIAGAQYRFLADLAQALTFVACGIIWNGVRLFLGRPVLWSGILVAPLAWLVASRFSGLAPGSTARVLVVTLGVAAYAFCIAFELWRERRQSIYTRPAGVIVPAIHATIFLMPIAMQLFLPQASADLWLTVFALQTIIYAVGTAFIVLLMVKEHDVQVFRNAASTDALTGLLNRRAFLEGAGAVCLQQGQRGGPVTVMMFDLDHFKSINDRFGHAVGDDVIRMFAQVLRSSLRANDIVGRLGGEEFAAIIPANIDVVARIGERIRGAFQAVGNNVGPHAIGATVSIGAAAARAHPMEVGPLLVRADAALYRAKNDGRNRLFSAEDEPMTTQVAGGDMAGPPAGAGRGMRQPIAGRAAVSVIQAAGR